MQLQQHYTPEQHHVWKQLYTRMQPRWERYANESYLKGLSALCFDPDRIPHLENVNRFLFPLTGFRAKAVGGYLPEPDIFHDIAGHVPMHTGAAFAETLVRFGQCAHTAVDRVAGIRDEHERLARLNSMITAMARFFWFTIEFGLMKGPDANECKVYGSGLLSSFGEMQHAVESPVVQRVPMQLEWVINQSFEIDRYQPLLFVVNDFEHLFDEVRRLGQWMKDGKLNNVAPGEPAISEADLRSFLEAGH